MSIHSLCSTINDDPRVTGGKKIKIKKPGIVGIEGQSAYSLSV